MEIKEIGKIGFIDRLTEPFVEQSPKAIKSFRDDATVLETQNGYELISTELYSEGVHFDLSLSPLKHLGYKCVVATLSDILAMNGTAKGILIALGIPSRFSVEDIEELYSGVKFACSIAGVELMGGDTTASINGLIISATAYGSVDKNKISYRSGAKKSDLICITGDLGASYLGTKLLEREKSILKGNRISTPKLEGYEYQLGKSLRPHYRKDIIEQLSQSGIVPTSMIDISTGLASEVLHICKESDCSARIFLNKLPIASSSFDLAQELHTDAVIAAMNGGEDYELMFTVDVSQYEEIMKIGGIDVVGYIDNKNLPTVLETPDGGELMIRAQGWQAVEE